MSRKMQSQQRTERKRAKQAKRRNIKRNKRAKRNKEQLADAFHWLLPDDSIFAKMKLHGNTGWLPRFLVFLAILWAWSESRQLTDAYVHAVLCHRSMFDSVIPATYQGFMGALARWTDPLMTILWPVLHQRMQEVGGKFWWIGGWVPIAFDGSRSTAPRTEANEAAFCAKNYGKGNTAKYRKKKPKSQRQRDPGKQKPQPPAPQAWITLLWHVGLRLPWTWRLGPSDSSERAHVMEMVASGKFPKNTLFCGDAGFVGYPLWSAIREFSYHFLIRVGANVTLLAESAAYQLEKGGEVLCWPLAMQDKQPPLRLRLVKIRIGKTQMYLLTSVLDEAQLSVAQMIALYKQRWGIEVEFRGLKQTLDRAKLRCRNDRRLLAELNWSIMAMAVAELFAVKEQLAKRSEKSRTKKQAADPAKRSLAHTMRALRGCMRNLEGVPERGQELSALLADAVTDSYVRKRPKTARHRPSKPPRKPTGAPNVRKMTVAEKKQAKEMEQKMAA
jgi:hypothetical protein